MNKRIAALGLAVLIINGAYLAAFAEPSIFYMGNVLLHLGLGLGLMVLPALYLVVRGNTLDHRWALWSHILLAVIAVALIGVRILRAFRPPTWKVALVTIALAADLAPVSAGLYHRTRPDPNDRIRNPLVAPVSMDQEVAGALSPFA